MPKTLNMVIVSRLGVHFSRKWRATRRPLILHPVVFLDLEYTVYLERGPLQSLLVLIGTQTLAKSGVSVH